MANLTSLTPEKETQFLTRLREMPNVSRACRLVKVSRQTAYEHRKSNPEFAQAWDDALLEGVESLEEHAWKQAKKGSDTLTIFLLKAHNPEKYRETVRQEHTGKNGAPIEVRKTLLSELSDEELDRIINHQSPPDNRPPG